MDRKHGDGSDGSPGQTDRIAQRERFEQTARELGADQDQDALDRVFGKVVPPVVPRLSGKTEATTMTRVANKDGVIGLLVLTSAPGPDPASRLCIVHMLDEHGNVMPSVKAPIAGPLGKQEAIRAAEQWAADNGWTTLSS